MLDIPSRFNGELLQRDAPVVKGEAAGAAAGVDSRNFNYQTRLVSVEASLTPSQHRTSRSCVWHSCRLHCVHTVPQPNMSESVQNGKLEKGIEVPKHGCCSWILGAKSEQEDGACLVGTILSGHPQQGTLSQAYCSQIAQMAEEDMID